MLEDKERDKAAKVTKAPGRAKGKRTSGGKNKGKAPAKASPKGKKRVLTMKPSTSRESGSSEDEEWPCLICGEPFSNSKSREVWVQCQQCLKWAHDDCTLGSPYFICPNCESDVGSSSEGSDI